MMPSKGRRLTLDIPTADWQQAQGDPTAYVELQYHFSNPYNFREFQEITLK